MEPRAVVSPDDLYLAMSADSTFYTCFRLLKLLLCRFPSDGGELTNVSHSCSGIERENLVDHFDRVAVLQRLQGIEDPVDLHIRQM